MARAKAIFQERNHATILTGLTLVHEMAAVDPALIPQFREVSSAPRAIRRAGRRALWAVPNMAPTYPFAVDIFVLRASRTSSAS